MVVGFRDKVAECTTLGYLVVPTGPGRPATTPATSRWTGAVGSAPPRATRRSYRPTGCWDCLGQDRSRLDASTRERPSPSAASSAPATLEATSRDQTLLPPATATRPGSTTPSPAPPARRSAGNPPRSPVSVPRQPGPSAGRSPPCRKLPERPSPVAWLSARFPAGADRAPRRTPRVPRGRSPSASGSPSI